MKKEKEQDLLKLDFPVATFPFDQKNERYKRNVWDKNIIDNERSHYKDIRYLKKAGFEKTDYAFRNAAWSIEHDCALGNARSNFGLYAWEGVSPKIKRFVQTDKSVKKSPREMSRIIKKAAHFLGADLVGICGIHPSWVYSHEYNMITSEHYPTEVPVECKNAIVMAVEMDYESIRTSPTSVAGAATGLGYSRMAYLAHMVAIFVRGLGYRAIPCGNDTALSVPLAMAAGLGETGRNGLLVTEKYGPRVRLCKVFTDLPLEYDSYHPLGVEEFCKTCKKCADNCPAKAIPHSDKTKEGPNISSHSGVLKWYINAEKCYAYWIRNRMDCTNCIMVCPFNKKVGIIHNAVRAIIKKTTLFNSFFTWIDSLLGYGKPRSAKTFWH